jgi:hypothetical protein
LCLLVGYRALPESGTQRDHLSKAILDHLDIIPPATDQTKMGQKNHPIDCRTMRHGESLLL